MHPLKKSGLILNPHIRRKNVFSDTANPIPDPLSCIPIIAFRV